jgi:hypothetical protein
VPHHYPNLPPNAAYLSKCLVLHQGPQTALADIPYQYRAELPAPNHGMGGPPNSQQHPLQMQPYQMQMQAMHQHAMYYQGRPQGQHQQRPQMPYYYPQPQVCEGMAAISSSGESGFNSCSSGWMGCQSSTNSGRRFHNCSTVGGIGCGSTSSSGGRIGRNSTRGRGFAVFVPAVVGILAVVVLCNTDMEQDHQHQRVCEVYMSCSTDTRRPSGAMALAITHVRIVFVGYESYLYPWNTPTEKSHQQPWVNQLLLMVAVGKQMLIARACRILPVYCFLRDSSGTCTAD